MSFFSDIMHSPARAITQADRVAYLADVNGASIDFEMRPMARAARAVFVEDCGLALSESTFEGSFHHWREGGGAGGRRPNRVYFEILLAEATPIGEVQPAAQRLADVFLECIGSVEFILLDTSLLPARAAGRLPVGISAEVS